MGASVLRPLVDRERVTMEGRLVLSVFLLLLALSCSTPSAEPPAISRDQTISVLPPNNQTGSPLFVSGFSSGRFVVDAEPITVGDLLAEQARSQLAARGFRVTPAQTVSAAAEGHVPRTPHAAAEIAAHGKLGGMALYIEIVQWQPDDPMHTKHVIVGLSASLVDTASRNVVWDFYRQPQAVATPGEITLKDAYEAAARSVITELLEGFRT